MDQTKVNEIMKRFYVLGKEERKEVSYLISRYESDGELAYPVSDGLITKGRKTIWWKCNEGPQEVPVNEHWENIITYPNCYSIQKPNFKIVYDC